MSLRRRSSWCSVPQSGTARRCVAGAVGGNSRASSASSSIPSGKGQPSPAASARTR